jgi:hypothetical protein
MRLHAAARKTTRLAAPKRMPMREWSICRLAPD